MQETPLRKWNEWKCLLPVLVCSFRFQGQSVLVERNRGTRSNQREDLAVSRHLRGLLLCIRVLVGDGRNPRGSMNIDGVQASNHKSSLLIMCSELHFGRIHCVAVRALSRLVSVDYGSSN